METKIETDRATVSSAKLVIGYRTRLLTDLDRRLPTFTQPAHTTDVGMVAESLAEQRKAFLDEAADMPYTGIFDEVYLVDMRSSKAILYSHAASEENNKPPVAVRVRNYLAKYYPAIWDSQGRHTGVLFIGFNIRRFLQMLSLECSLPAIAKPCPTGLWTNTRNYYDIGEAVLPGEYSRRLTLPYVLGFRRPLELSQSKKWDELTAEWGGPGISTNADALIATELASQLDLL